MLDKQLSNDDSDRVLSDMESNRTCSHPPIKIIFLHLYKLEIQVWWIRGCVVIIGIRSVILFMTPNKDIPGYNICKQWLLHVHLSPIS